MAKVLTDFRYVSVDHLVEPEQPTYQHLAVGEEFQNTVYEFLKSFWYDRHKLELSDDELQDLLDDYKNTYNKPLHEPTRDLLKSILDGHPAGTPLSIIDLGCANGTLLHYLKSIDAMDDVRFVGVEPYQVFADDFRETFPEHQVVVGNAEEFPDMDFSPHADLPVTVVFFSLVLYMLSPEVAKRCLKKAAEMTDLICGFDYCLNAYGEIESNDDEVVMLEYNAPTGQIYFAHEYEKYFDDLGFRFETTSPPTRPVAGREVGHAAFRARRIKT